MNNSKTASVKLSDESLRRIVAESIEKPELETGGVLLGTSEEMEGGLLEIQVKRATGPGGKAEHRPGLFRPQMEHYRKRVAFYRDKKGWDYLGEWHKHPGRFGSLSGIDLKTAGEICASEGWPFLLLPIVTLWENRYRVDCYLWLSHGEEAGRLIHADIYEGQVDELINRGGAAQMKLYVEQSLVEGFRNSTESAREYLGVCNKDESLVFMPTLGVKNARLRLIRPEGDFSLKSAFKEVLGVVDGESACFYTLFEGEMLPLQPVLVDTQTEVYERNAGLLETMELKNKTVTLVGCGSLGGAIALELARAGVGEFCLFDMDTVEPPNLSRHIAGLDDLGRFKTSAVAEKLCGVNPNLKISCCTRNVVEDPEGTKELEEAANRSHLLICTTDTDDSRVLTNDLSIKLGVPSLQVGLHERAESGIVQLVSPERKNACFSCHRRRVLSESSLRSEKVAYSEAEDPRDLYIQPGLSAQIGLVAEVGALRAIEVLMDSEPIGDLTVVYVDETDGEGGDEKRYDPRKLSLRIRHLNMERVENCPICGKEE